MSETVTSIFEIPEDREFCFTLTDTDDSTYALFQELKLQSGGYTWLGITKSLIELKAPGLRDNLRILGAEGDNMYAYAASREVLDTLNALIRSAVADRALMMAAIKNAGDDLE